MFSDEQISKSVQFSTQQLNQFFPYVALAWWTPLDRSEICVFVWDVRSHKSTIASIAFSPDCDIKVCNHFASDL